MLLVTKKEELDYKVHIIGLYFLVACVVISTDSRLRRFLSVMETVSFIICKGMAASEIGFFLI